MIYLSKGFFLSAFILMSIPLLPLTVTSIVFLIKTFQSEYLFCALISMFLYALLAFISYKISQGKKYYLSVDNEKRMTIKYPNFTTDNDAWCINCSDVLRVEYYKILSIRSLLLLLDHNGPHACFIVCVLDGKEVYKFIGYPSYAQIKQLCEENGIPFVKK